MASSTIRIIVACALLTGCGETKTAPPPPTADVTAPDGDITTAVEAMAERACKCDSRACARTSIAEFVAFTKANWNAKNDAARTQAAGARFAECVIATGVSQAELSNALTALTPQ
ncbi:MAG: hypothetical protein IPL79_12795 [Myxococcales bacterium]|nr:hypothetical protein [Myxococcales bacterium]